MAEKDRLEDNISISKMSLKDAPNGTLRLSQSNNYLQFYHCTEENKLGKYITKGNDELIRKLAQKSYDEIEQIFLKEHKERQRIIQPVEPTWEQRLIEWKAREYQGKGFGDEIPMLVTERGERVRSKSEKIMADYFHRHGIEYKYECPLYLKGMGMVYPDFTFLSKRLGNILGALWDGGFSDLCKKHGAENQCVRTEWNISGGTLDPDIRNRADNTEYGKDRANDTEIFVIVSPRMGD